MSDGGPSLAFHPLYPEVKDELLSDKTFSKNPQFENVDGTDVLDDFESADSKHSASTSAGTSGAMNGDSHYMNGHHKKSALDNEIPGQNSNGYEKQKSRRCCS